MTANRRNILIIAGITTEAVVIHVATISCGYRDLIPVDASGGLSETTEAAALRQIEAFGGETTSVVTLATSTHLKRYRTTLVQYPTGASPCIVLVSIRESIGSDT